MSKPTVQPPPVRVSGQPIKAQPKFSIEIKVMDLDIVKQLSQALIDVSKDERIPIGVREELCDRVSWIFGRTSRTEG